MICGAQLLWRSFTSISGKTILARSGTETSARFGVCGAQQKSNSRDTRQPLSKVDLREQVAALKQQGLALEQTLPSKSPSRSEDRPVGVTGTCLLAAMGRRRRRRLVATTRPSKELAGARDLESLSEKSPATNKTLGRRGCDWQRGLVLQQVSTRSGTHVDFHQDLAGSQTLATSG